jgi:hypothetical protein
MSQGVIIFAQNNADVDYIKLATFAARQVQKHLDLPVSLITDSRGWLETSQPNHPFDKIIDVEYTSTAQKKKFHDGALTGKSLEWRNFARNRAYDLTPYETTLVIDSDYIINSDVLKSAFNRDIELQIYSNSTDLAGWRDTSEFKRINEFSIPFYWATAFIFQKTKITQAFFDLIAYIKSNWNYYRVLYNIDSTLFRNDYAFSIAIHIMSGKCDSNFVTELPGSMIYITDKDLLVSGKDNKMQFLVEKKNYPGEYLMVKTENLDVHIMNKFSLSRYIDGGSGV